METWEWLVLGVATLTMLFLAFGLVRIRRRRAHLRERFGSEYHRSVSENGRGAAERTLDDIARERAELEVRPIPVAARDRYLDEWRQAELRFISDPRDAARTAERLVDRVLEDRGYVVHDDFEHRVRLLAVDHPDVTERYRHGRFLLQHVDGGESTEHLRKAMLDLRAVFEEMLETARTTTEEMPVAR